MTVINIFAFANAEKKHTEKFDWFDPFFYDIDHDPVFRPSMQDLDEWTRLDEKGQNKMMGLPILDTHGDKKIGSILDAWLGQFGDLVIQANINQNIAHPEQYEASIGYFILTEPVDGDDMMSRVSAKIPVEVSLCMHGSEGRQAGCWGVAVENCEKKPYNGISRTFKKKISYSFESTTISMAENKTSQNQVPPPTTTAPTTQQPTIDMNIINAEREKLKKFEMMFAQIREEKIGKQIDKKCKYLVKCGKIKEEEREQRSKKEKEKYCGKVRNATDEEFNELLEMLKEQNEIISHLERRNAQIEEKNQGLKTNLQQFDAERMKKRKPETYTQKEEKKKPKKDEPEEKKKKEKAIKKSDNDMEVENKLGEEIDAENNELMKDVGVNEIKKNVDDSMKKTNGLEPFYEKILQNMAIPREAFDNKFKNLNTVRKMSIKNKKYIK